MGHEISLDSRPNESSTVAARAAEPPEAGPGSSAVAEIAKRWPEGVPVVKTFNTTFAVTLVDGPVTDHDLDVLIAADDAAATATVKELVESGGIRAIDAGPLRRAEQLASCT